VAYAAHGDTINTALKVFTGTHQITVQSLDASGNSTASASLTVDGEPSDISPTAHISVTAMPNISPTTVLACTATSSDPDGFVNGLLLQYSDGSKFSTPAALETFAVPGTYTATVTVTDNFGATNTTTTTFSVGGGSVTIMDNPVNENLQRQQDEIPSGSMQPRQQAAPSLVLGRH
jgi:hypothetical protein